jgi:hypothetical protein
MTLAEYRATRRYMPIEEAIIVNPYLGDLDLDKSFTHAMVYGDGCFILHSRRGFYLMLETDEYESRDLALLEFVLWQWMLDGDEMDSLRAMIWG